MCVCARVWTRVHRTDWQLVLIILLVPEILITDVYICRGANSSCFIFMSQYWYATAEGDAPETKPVVLWLNGGPGSSSTLGFLQELGPLLLNNTGGLHANPYAWTKLANVFAIESPVGVGYSYCSAQKEGKVCQNTDKFTASTARAAMVDFFKTKFPELAQNDFFITGESYAGVYIPTLAKEILDNAPQINLVGLAIGDPCTDNTAQADSMDSVWYSHKYGLIPDAEFDLLWNQCKLRQPNIVMQGGKYAVREKVKRHVLDRHEVDLGSPETNLADEDVKTIIRKAIREVVHHPGDDFVGGGKCNLAYRKFLMSTSHGLSQGWPQLYIDDYSFFGPGGFDQEDEDMATYMMRDDVREALHVSDAPTTTWPHPPQGFDYTSEYDACNWGDIPEGAPSMIDVVREIAPKLDIVQYYNGDTDPCVSWEGTRTAIERVGFKEIKGGSMRPWFYNHTAASMELIAEKSAMFGPDLLTVPTGAQFGGEYVNYENGLSFMTVHGSGHMVPAFRPQASLAFIEKVLKRELLSPLMPSNHTLVEMTDDEFEDAINTWTVSAMGPPYVGAGIAPNNSPQKLEGDLNEAKTE